MEATPGIDTAKVADPDFDMLREMTSAETLRTESLRIHVADQADSR